MKNGVTTFCKSSHSVSIYILDSVPTLLAAGLNMRHTCNCLLLYSISGNQLQMEKINQFSGFTPYVFMESGGRSSAVGSSDRSWCDSGVFAWKRFCRCGSMHTDRSCWGGGNVMCRLCTIGPACSEPFWRTVMAFIPIVITLTSSPPLQSL